MTQQSFAAVQRRRSLATLGMVVAVLGAGVLAFFSGPSVKPAAEKPSAAPATRPAPARPAAAPARPAPAKPAKPSKPLIDEKVLWNDPPQWKRLPSSGMRFASYQIPAAPGDKLGGDLNVFILGGDVEENLQRWVDEFSNFNAKTLVRSHRTVNGMPQAIVEIPNGHFNGGMGDTKASDNYGLLGAIVTAPSTAAYFLKLTGPSKTVKAARKPFYELLDSIRVEKGAAPSSEKPAEVPAAAAPPAAAPPAAQPPAAAPAGSTAHP